MKSFNVKIVTPDKNFFEGEAVGLIAKTTEGDIGILAGHEKYLAYLPSGPIKLKIDGETEKTAAVSGGVLKVSGEEAIILAIAAEWADEIDVGRAERSKEDALKRLEQHARGREHELAELKLKRALNRLKVSGKK